MKILQPRRSAGTQAHTMLGDFTADRRILLLMAMALVVGSAGAAGAWFLLKLIAGVTNLAWFHRLSTEAVSLASVEPGWMVVALPVLGGLAIGLMARFGSDKIRGHGIPEAIEAILIGRSRMSAKVAVLKPLSSAISIGTGGPFGAEGPIIMTGGALGSLFAQFFAMSSAERKTLLVAGAAAGMTAVFGTPAAAILLAVELLLFEWKPRSFLPVITAVLVAALWRPILIGSGPLFPFADNPSLPWWALGLYLTVGAVAGLQSCLLTVILYKAEDLFGRLPVHWMWWPAIGGVAVGLGGLIEPGAMGVGYDVIGNLLGGRMAGGEVVTMLLVKAAIWIVALASGTSGGVLAPLLILGGSLGALEGMALPGDTGFWALLGMAAMMGGTMRAPLTGAFFALELTGDAAALPAILAATAAAYAVTVLLLKRSILTEKIARHGHHVVREYAVDPFELMRVAEVMVRDVESLPSDMPVDEAVAFFSSDRSRHKSYPVVDADRRLVGLVTRSDVLRWVGEGPHEGQALAELVAADTPTTGRAEEMIATLADRMIANDRGRAPIIDAEGRLVGLVSRKDLLMVRARAGAQEAERNAFFRVGPGGNGRKRKAAADAKPKRAKSKA